MDLSIMAPVDVHSHHRWKMSMSLIHCAIRHFFIFDQNDPAHGSDVLHINISNYKERILSSDTWKLVKT